MKRLKISRKGLTIIEASFIYCKRYNLNISINEFLDSFYSDDNFDEKQDIIYEDICEDLRCFRRFKDYSLKEITVEEYDLCVEEFGGEEYNLK